MIAITEKEFELIQTFREQVADVLENEYKRSPGYLVQWIRYAGHDIVKAEAAFRRTVRRQELRIDTILQENIENYSELFPSEFTVDKTGAPVVIAQFGKWDIRKEVDAGNRDQLFRFMIQWCERTAFHIQEQAEKTNGAVNQFSGIFDLNGFSYRPLGSAKTIRLMTDLAHTAETHWPLTVNTLYLINAPIVIKVLLTIVKPFLSSTTVSGTKVFNSKRDWESALLKQVDANELPTYYGGTKNSIFNRTDS